MFGLREIREIEQHALRPLSRGRRRRDEEQGDGNRDDDRRQIEDRGPA